MVLAKFGACCSIRTPGSDPTKGGLPSGNVVEVDLERKGQKAQPNFIHPQVGTGSNVQSVQVYG